MSVSEKDLIAVVLTRNEARHIAACIRSVRPWVQTVVVWDSGSTDATRDLALSAGAVVVHRPFDHYAGQRQAALDSLSSRWIFFVDADERVTPELGKEVQRIVQTADPASECAGYWIPRRNVIVGREMRAGGFVPDYQMRLLRRSRCWYDRTRAVHEVVCLDGDAGYTEQSLIHFNYSSWAQFHRKQRMYARYEAGILRRRGIEPRPHNFVLQPLREFRRRFFQLQGWRDGGRGLLLALLLAWYYGAVPYWLLLRRQD